MRGYQGVRFKFVDDPATYAAHDAMLLENLSGEMGADRSLEDGDRIDLGGGVTLTTVHTPGYWPARSRSCSTAPVWRSPATRSRGGERAGRSR